MKCQFCTERIPTNNEGVINGFIVERNGRRAICNQCAAAIAVEVTKAFLGYLPQIKQGLLRHFEDWLEGYLQYTENQEATQKLHFWVGASVLSAALKRQIFMKRVRYNLYPNLYVLIVAESAVARKSIAMDLGVKMLKDADPEHFYLAGSMTPEGLVKHLNREKQVVSITVGGAKKVALRIDSYIMIHADELAEAFGYDRTRASRFTILLTKIYGAPDEHTDTLAGDPEQKKLINLYPVFLAGTDPVNLKVLPEDAVAGLIGRIIFVTEDQKKRSIPWEKPEESAQADKLYGLLKEDLLNISKIKGEMLPTPEAKEYFSQWYEKLGEKRIEDRRTDAFRQRCHDTALKLAMILAVSHSDDLIVTEKQIERAINYIERQLPEFAKIADWAATSVYAQNRAKFIEFLRRQGGAGTRSTMMKMLGLPLDEIVVLEGSLEQEHTIEVRIAGKNVFYKLNKD